MRLRALCAALLPALAALAFPLQAQQKLAVTLDDAVRIGLENSKQLHASQARVDYAGARVSEIKAARLPSLKLNGGYTRVSEVAPFEITLPFGGATGNRFVLNPSILNNYSARATLVQPLFTGFRLQASQNAAEYSAQASEEDLGTDRQDFIYNVKNAYWGVFKAQELKKVVDENVAQVQAHLDDARNLLDQGLATTNDVLKIQVQLSSVRLTQIDAANGVRLARLNLNNLMGVPLNTETDITTTVVHQPDAFPDLPVLIAKALQGRPDLKGMQYRVQAGEEGVTAARAGWWPQITLVGNYTTARPNPRIVPAIDALRDTWDVGVNVSLDIWNWGAAAHQTTQAQAQLTQAREALAQMKDGVALDVTQNYLSLQQAKEKISLARQTVEQAEENQRITSEKFKEGLSLTSDLLDADVALLQARTSLTQTLVDYELAEARLLRSVGDGGR